MGMPLERASKANLMREITVTRTKKSLAFEWSKIGDLPCPCHPFLISFTLGLKSHADC
jgi:hypothetical protein